MSSCLRLHVEMARETDGRFIASVAELPGVLVYGTSEAEARNSACRLALDVLGTEPAKLPENVEFIFLKGDSDEQKE